MYTQNQISESWYLKCHNKDQVSLKTTSALGRARLLFDKTYDMYSKYKNKSTL